MAVIALCSAKSAGATTSALALTLTWPRAALLVEADPAGSDLHPGFLRSRGRLERGLLAAAMAVRRQAGPAALLEQATTLDARGERLLITGLTDPAHSAVAAAAWSELSGALRALPALGVHHDVILDCGRLGHRHEPTPLLTGADTVVLVLRPTITQVHRTLTHLPALRPSPPAPAPRLLLAAIGTGEVDEKTLRTLSAEAGAGYLGALPEDQRAAAILAGHGEAGRGLERTALLRSARALATTLATVAPAPRPPAAEAERPGHPGPPPPQHDPVPGGEHVSR